TGSAAQALLKQGCDLVWLTRHGRLVGRSFSRAGGTGTRRVAQVHTLAGQEGGRWAQAVVDAKLAAQRALVVRLRQNRPRPAMTAAVVALRRLRERCAAVVEPPVLLGIEGQGAAVYYPALAAAVGPEAMGFDRRSRRPPLDPFNACLSFGYTLLLTQVEASCERVGLDRFVGGLHSPGRGKPALALDAMEPLRPWVDRLVLTLVNRRQLQPGEFVPVEEGVGVHLNQAGRAVFLRAFYKAWRGRLKHPEDGRQLTLDDWLDDRLYALARWCAAEGEGLVPSFGIGAL
ncbi:MAG: CRISPR-associated endonuclease Cas1, partial [Myxococcales bacterium]|nr:CRISPR-associated endonuclease Cas1 [Myxococcales bacterium]